MIKKTFCMLKPDIISRNLVANVLQILIQNRFTINKIISKKLSIQELEEFYKDHKEKSFFPNMIKNMSNSLLIGCELLYEGNGVEKLRILMGSTNPLNAEIGTIRYMYGISIDDNSIHGSDSEANVLRESEIFFGKI